MPKQAQRRDRNGYTKNEREVKQLMDLGIQVQARHHRGMSEAAEREEVQLKTQALMLIAKAKAPRDPKLLADFIRHTRNLAKLGLATVKLDFARRTA